MAVKYLFNGISNPRTANTIFRCVGLGRVERNPGDMVYAYAVMNALAVNRDVEFIPTGYYYYKGYSDRQIARFNEECKAFVLPLANIFCKDWVWLLNLYTPLIRKLAIPCVVPCVGVTEASSRNVGTARCDQAVKDFVNAVLDKSSKIGLRGELTAAYLERLGYVRGRHFEVIGCPSMYTYGAKIPDIAFQGKRESCAFSLNQRSDIVQWRFIKQIADLFQRQTFVSQFYPTFCRNILQLEGLEGGAVKANLSFFAFVDQWLKNDQKCFFLNRKPWIEFLRSMDFYVGHRIHGALLSIQAGTPAVVVPFESRTEELARFHGIPMIRPPEGGVTNERLLEILNELDFSAMKGLQRDNFSRYHKFLRDNGLTTVFDNEGCAQEFPLEKDLAREYPDDELMNFLSKDRLLRAKLKLYSLIACARDSAARVRTNLNRISNHMRRSFDE